MFEDKGFYFPSVSLLKITELTILKNKTKQINNNNNNNNSNKKKENHTQ